MTVSNEMSPVLTCAVTRCTYNVNQNCHAKAITIGDLNDPNCDTFFDAPEHTQEKQRIAGVGACKVAACRFNEDFECTAENISIGFSGPRINCLTFAPSP